MSHPSSAQDNLYPTTSSDSLANRGTMTSDLSRTPTASNVPAYQSPSGNFMDKTPAMTASRKIYLKMAIVCVAMISIVILGILPLYWGALYTAPKPLTGWIVDFDGSRVGSFVAQGLQNAPTSTIFWKVVPASDFPNGPSDLQHAIRDEKAWVAVAINSGATDRLDSAVASADAAYDGKSAITAYGNEARQETAYRSFLQPNLRIALPQVSAAFALQEGRRLAGSSNLASLMAAAPQLVSQPISYTIVNLLPFDQPVAIAVTFVGLIYLLILSFFILNIMTSARTVVSGLEPKLSTASLLRVRISTLLIQYLVLSLVFTILSRAFQLKFERHFGRAGFPLIWAVNYCGMLALGLALESLLTILTIRFVGFFLIIWVVVNVSVAVLPISVQPVLYRYGYAMPFYNVSRAVRTIVFGTKNELRINFGILIAWAVLSLCTMSLFQIFVRRREHAAGVATAEARVRDDQKENKEQV